MSATSLPQRFVAQATISGYDVIDAETGRPMGFERDERRAANGIAQQLNLALKAGPRALAYALRAS